jgi:hypothetical protein
MANIEAAYELRDLASVLFASEDTIGVGDQGTLRSAMALNAALQGEQLDARVIARQAVIQVKPTRKDYGFATASAIDLDRIADVKSALNVLARDLIAALPMHRDEIGYAYQYTPRLDGFETFGQRDLWTFCKLLQRVGDAAVRRDALAVTATLRLAILHAGDQEGSCANGLSVYMPYRPADLAEAKAAGYGRSRFAADTLWDEFLSRLLPQGEGGAD